MKYIAEYIAFRKHYMTSVCACMLIVCICMCATHWFMQLAPTRSKTLYTI